MSLFSEIKKGFKKLIKENLRVPLKIWEEGTRPLTSKSGGLFQSFKPAEIPPTPVPNPPPEQIADQASDEIRRRQRSRVSGRRRTIVTGDLSPVNPQKTTLLGRTSPR